jgi:hypothetical protein
MTSMFRTVMGPAFICALSSLSSVGFAQVSVTPAAPKPQETVRVLVAPLPISVEAFATSNRTVTMVGNKITIDLGRQGMTVGAPGPTPPLDMVVGQFPAGDYQVEVRRPLDSGGMTTVGTAAFSIAANSLAEPLQNNTDLWWNPSESGWGLNVVQHGSGVIFATWFNYGPDGKPIWYVVPEGRWKTNTAYLGPIYRTTGPEVGDTFNPALVTRTLVGDAILDFWPFDASRMTAVLTVDGSTLVKELRRQAF